MPGDGEPWPNLTGGESIVLFARLRGGVDTKQRDQFVERFDLDHREKGRTCARETARRSPSSSALPRTWSDCSSMSPQQASIR